MSVLNTLGKTLDTIATNERMVELSRGQKALSEGLSNAREDANRARQDSFALQEENLELSAQNQKLKTALGDARNLLEEMTMRNEAFARTILHLRKNWEPQRDEEERRLEVKGLLDKKTQEVNADETYKNGVKARINNRFKVK